MKKLIAGIAMSIMILTGCAGPGASISQIGGLEEGTVIQETLYEVEQEGVITLEALEKELKNNNINLVKVSGEVYSFAQYNVEDDEGRIIIFTNTSASPGNQIISSITIDHSSGLSQHPIVKGIANVMGEEKLLTWVGEQEGRVKGADDNNDDIMEILPLGRCYLSFEYWPGSETKTLKFSWALKPHISKAFQEIARQLEDQGMITTGYIKGPGGETLIATNSDYYLLTKRGSHRGQAVDMDISQGATYRIMHDSQSGHYSVQIYGYMKEDLSYITTVETMPCLDEITQLMNMDHEDFLAITDEINKELTGARELQNYNLQRESYIEGEIGEYRYIISVPQGIETYNFTVLIEEK